MTRWRIRCCCRLCCCCRRRDVAGCLPPDASDFFSEPPVDLSDEEASAVFFSLDSDPPSLFVPLAPTLAFLSARLSVR